MRGFERSYNEGDFKCMADVSMMLGIYEQRSGNAYTTAR